MVVSRIVKHVYIKHTKLQNAEKFYRVCVESLTYI